MASSASQSSVKFIAIGRLGQSELHDYYTPNDYLVNDQLIEECLKVLAENQLSGNYSGDLHYHATKHEDFVLFLQHGNSRLDELLELKILEELNTQWKPDMKLVNFMAQMNERPKKINRPNPKGTYVSSIENKSSQEVLPSTTTSNELTLASHRKAAASSVDQIKLMMAEDQRFKQRTAVNPTTEAIKLMIIDDQRTGVHTPKTEDTTTLRSSNKDTPGIADNNKQDLVILGAESNLGETKDTKTENSAESTAVAEELKKIKQASTNKKIFVVIILVLAVVVFALVPVLTR